MNHSDQRWMLAFAALLAANLSMGCKATCREGQYLRDGLCHSAPQSVADAGAADQTTGDGGSETASTGTRKQATSASDAGVSTNKSTDAAARESKHDSGMSGGATNGSSKGAPLCGNGVREGMELCDGADCKTAAECDSNNACVVSHLEGSAKTCDAQCTTTEITACNSGDGCCPSGCDQGTDDDCSPSCGDGVLTGMETCEPGSSQHPCPTLASCDDGDPCTEDSVTGSAQQCSATCANKPLKRKQVDCDDANPCTDDESAESTTECTFECQHSKPRKPTGSCEDSDPCTDDTPVMSDTACKYECPHKRKQPPTASCNDNNSCTDDTPEMSRTECVFACPHTPEKVGTSCGDGRMCSDTGRCEAPPERCGDGVVTQNEECDPAAPGQVAGYTCNSSCRRLNKLTKCDGPSQCEGSPPGKCDVPGICRPLCSNEGSPCDILPGASKNESQCISGACAYLCTVYQGVDAEHCGPTLWCDGMYCRVKP